MSSSELIDKFESLDLKDVTQNIIINPIEIVCNRTQRVPVILTARDGQDIRPKLGVYSINGGYLRPTQVNKWVMVLLFDSQAVDDLARGNYTFDDIKNFADCYMQYGRSKGISITPLTSIQCIPAQATIEKNVETLPRQDLKDELRRLFIKLNDNLVNHAIIILPDALPSWVHGHLQYLETCTWDRELTDGDGLDQAEDKLMRTSRIRLKTLMDVGIKSSCGGRGSLIPHVWLKYNIKLGGLSVCLKRTFDTHDMKFLNDSSLVISIDLAQQVAHQSPESPLISVAVGMWDLASSNMSFHTQTRVQARLANDRIDLMAVSDLDQMIAGIIAAYKKRKDNHIPTRVIVLRAGSYQKEHNESIVLEIVSIKKALSEAHALAEAANSGQQVKDPVLTYLKLHKKKVFRKYQDPTKLPVRQPGSESLVQTGSLVNSIIGAQLGVDEAKSKFHPVLAPKFPPVVRRDNETRLFTPDRSNSHMYKLYDEANMSNGAIQAMVHTLSFLSPRVTAMTRPTPIDLADLAGERSSNIVVAWMDENRIKPDDPEYLSRVNRFLATEMGDRTYKDHLYYV